MTTTTRGLPGQAWDDACEHLQSGAPARDGDPSWRLRVLEEALRLACVDVVRLCADGGMVPLAPHELVGAYVATAEQRLLVGHLELEGSLPEAAGGG